MVGVCGFMDGFDAAVQCLAGIVYRNHQCDVREEVQPDIVCRPYAFKQQNEKIAHGRYDFY